MTDKPVTTEMMDVRFRHGNREAHLFRREDWAADSAEAPRIYWELWSDEHKIIARYDDDIYPAAQQAAVRYLMKMAEVDDLRAQVAEAEREALSEWQRTGDMFKRVRHFHAKDMGACV